MRSYGEILDIEDELCTIPRLLNSKTGDRVLVMRLTQPQRPTIPHKRNLGTYTALFTMNGGPPLWLKCGEIGHIRSSCPQQNAAQSELQRVLEQQRGYRVSKHSLSTDDLDWTYGTS